MMNIHAKNPSPWFWPQINEFINEFGPTGVSIHDSILISTDGLLISDVFDIFPILMMIDDVEHSIFAIEMTGVSPHTNQISMRMEWGYQTIQRTVATTIHFHWTSTLSF